MQLLDARSFASTTLLRAQRRGWLWPAWWGLLLLALAALMSGALVWRAQSQQVAASQAALSDAVARAAAAAAAAGSVAPPVDFTVALPLTAPMDNLLRDAFRTASRVGVVVVSAEPQDALSAPANVLPHAVLALRLAGPYGGIKTVLGELLARYPGLTVAQLRIQRSTSGGTQEAAVTLQQWLRPRGAPAVSAERGR